MILALITIEKPIIVVSIEEPPYDIIGNGEPTIGSSPKTIDIFIDTYRKIANAKLKQKIRAKKLLESSPILITLNIIIAYKINNNIEP